MNGMRSERLNQGGQTLWNDEGFDGPDSCILTLQPFWKVLLRVIEYKLTHAGLWCIGFGIWHFRASDSVWDAWWSLNIFVLSSLTRRMCFFIPNSLKQNWSKWPWLNEIVKFYSRRVTRLCNKKYVTAEKFSIWDTLHAWNKWILPTSSTLSSVISIVVVFAVLISKEVSFKWNLY